MSKINPRRIPRTQADVERAFRDGETRGIHFMLTLVLFILLDKHEEVPEEDVKQLSEDVHNYCDSINRGYLSFADIVRTLKEEHGLEVELR